MLFLLSWFALSACQFSQPRVVSITPDYGYVDGCTSVVIQGSKLGTDAKASIDGQPFLSLTPAEEVPTSPEWAQDVGFKYTGITPASSDGEPGFRTVVLEVDGKTTELFKGFYFRTCPNGLTVDYVDASPLTVGQALAIEGCGLDVNGVTAQLLSVVDGAEVASAPITSTCGSASVEMAIPAVPDGMYYLQVSATDGRVAGGFCETASDTSDTASTCADTYIVTVGGAQ